MKDKPFAVAINCEIRMTPEQLAENLGAIWDQAMQMLEEHHARAFGGTEGKLRLLSTLEHVTFQVGTDPSGATNIVAIIPCRYPDEYVVEPPTAPRVDG